MLVESNLITVHGREACVIPYSRWSSDGDAATEIDISDEVLWIEVPQAGLRKRLVGDPVNPLGLRIVLTRTDVAALPAAPCEFAVVDEGAEYPIVDWAGMIRRTGFVGDPS